MNIFDAIIIGGGPAGLTAALYLLREKRNILLIEKSATGGQIINTKKLDNFPGFTSITGADLMEKLLSQVDRLGLEIIYDTVINCQEVLEESQRYFKITTEFGDILNTKTVLLANGLTYRKFGYNNEEALIGKGISYCPTCDGPFYSGKDVNLIGDGPAAMQYVNILSEYVNHVYMYTLTENLFGEKVVIDSIKKNKKITQIPNASLKEFIGTDHLEGLVFNIDGEEKVISTDNVFIAIGKIPNKINIESKYNVDFSQYISVDENMETGVPGIFAAGDVVEKPVKQVITACSDGAIAAVSISKYIMNNK